jgi:predicted secreted protein
MDLFTGSAIFLTIWWTVLFAILPLGGKTHWSEGLEVPVKGMDPGAPITPNLKKKFIWCTIVSAAVWVLLWCTLHFHWVRLPDFPHNY